MRQPVALHKQTAPAPASSRREVQCCSRKRVVSGGLSARRALPVCGHSQALAIITPSKTEASNDHTYSQTSQSSRRATDGGGQATARKQNRAELYNLIKTWVRGKTRQELWDGLRAIDYFGAPVLSMGEVIEDPHIKERQAFIDRDHPTAGPVKLLAPWIHMSKTPASIRSDSPSLGQHTDEVLGQLLGLGNAEIGELRSQGIVK